MRGYTSDITMEVNCRMTVKTAISLDQRLFKEAESMASAMKVSRSHFFGLALREFLRKQKSRQMLERLNRVYGDSASGAETDALARAHRPSHRKLVEGSWWFDRAMSSGPTCRREA